MYDDSQEPLEEACYDDDEFGIMEEAEHERERRGVIAALSGWSSSLVVHSILVALLTSIALWQEPEREPLPPMVMQPPEDVVDDIMPDPVTREPVDVDPIDVEENDPVDDQKITELELPPVEEPSEVDDIIEEPVVAKDMGDIDLQNNAAFMAIGPGALSAGKGGDMFSRRGRKIRGGGDGIRSRVRDVELALRWFKRHQSLDGSWDVDGYADNCKDNPKCEPGTAYTQMEIGDVACTGYALLCFLGSGYDHVTPNQYRSTVHAALQWLKEQSTDAKDGQGIILSNNIYAQAVAAKAVIEAYGMTGDRRLRGLAQGVTDRLVALQNPGKEEGYGLGWNYSPSATRNDASVSGWVIMALKSAGASGLDVGNSMHGAKSYVKGAWQAMNPNWKQLGSQDETGFPYSWNPQTGEAKKDSLAPAGALCAIFLGAKQGDVMLETMCNYIEARQTPAAYPLNTYYAYYNTFAMFQAGGDHWKRWNKQVMPLIQEAQRKDGNCFNGSWDYEGTKFHGHETGRLLSTAYNCLCLQVQWMYTRIEG